MNSKILASALIVALGAVAAPSFAENIPGEVGYFPSAPVASTSQLTREQVRNEYIQARNANELPPQGEGADLGHVASNTTSQLTRAEVKNAYLQAAREDKLPPMGEGADLGYTPSKSLLSRDAVHAEAVRAVREGSIVGGEV